MEKNTSWNFRADWCTFTYLMRYVASGLSPLFVLQSIRYRQWSSKFNKSLQPCLWLASLRATRNGRSVWSENSTTLAKHFVIVSFTRFVSAWSPRLSVTNLDIWAPTWLGSIRVFTLPLNHWSKEARELNPDSWLRWVVFLVQMSENFKINYFKYLLWREVFFATLGAIQPVIV